MTISSLSVSCAPSTRAGRKRQGTAAALNLEAPLPPLAIWRTGWRPTWLASDLSAPARQDDPENAARLWEVLPFLRTDLIYLRVQSSALDTIKASIG